MAIFSKIWLNRPNQTTSAKAPPRPRFTSGTVSMLRAVLVLKLMFRLVNLVNVEDTLFKIRYICQIIFSFLYYGNKIANHRFRIV